MTKATTTHELDAFVAMLKQHGVTAVADVRSQPYSRRLEQFIAKTCRGAGDAGIGYVFLGDELGAARGARKRECYDGDRADYRRIAELPKFRAGLDRLARRRGAVSHRTGVAPRKSRSIAIARSRLPPSAR